MLIKVATACDIHHEADVWREAIIAEKFRG
jgi:hypothetical protein